tara:strand:+ start:301 stop:621 length:321 start_codon:yes stop_codon:yes gene_type:complete
MAKEIWKKKGNYEISSRGKVRNASTKKLLKPYDRNGYKRFDLMSNGKRKTVSVHKLQQQLFNGHKGTRKQHVDHKDGDRANNNLSNQESVSAKVNMQRRSKRNKKK